MGDYYAALNLTQQATKAQIKAAFRALAKQHHPDKTGSNDTSAFRRIRKAYEALSDPIAKAEYDRNYPGAQVHAANYDYNTDYNDERRFSRTDAYEAMEAEEARRTRYRDREAREAPPVPSRPPSPPPKKPVRKYNEPSWAYYMGKAYQAWEKRDAAYRARHPEYEQQP